MVVTRSVMPELGTKLPNFSLPDVVTGKIITPFDFTDKKAFLVIFLCRHCPFARHAQKGITKFAKDYKNKDLGIVAICSNDSVSIPEDAPDGLKEQATDLNFIFPYLFDETQEVAKDFKASCTPDFFLYDKERKLVYRGQFDSSRPGNFKFVTGKDVRFAVDCVLNDKPIGKNQKPSMGCNIKWKLGAEPDYFLNP